jgi:hypothetical protein
MPDRRRHRGPHPDDERLFCAAALPVLRAAAGDYSWLLSRGYAEKSALKLVGDRFQLTARQRLAVRRSSCADAAREDRVRKQHPPGAPPGEPLSIDGYNALITVESALSGGFILCGRDGCYRDLASLHGTYRSVEETAPAIELVGEVIAAFPVGRVTWYLDAPVSNSGRLARLMLEIARRRRWDWSAQLDASPDRTLAAAEGVVATSDSWILDHCRAWTNLAREVITRRVQAARVIEL